MNLNLIRRIKRKIVSKTKINSINLKYISIDQGLLSIGVSNHRAMKRINNHGANLVIKHGDYLLDLQPTKVNSGTDHIANFFDLTQLTHNISTEDEIEWQVWLKIQSNSYKLKGKDKSIRNFLHTQKSYIHDYIVFPKMSKHQNLKLTQYAQGQELKYLINEVTQVKSESDRLIVYGNVDENLLKRTGPFENIAAKMQVREKHIYNQYKLEWLNNSEWYFEIPTEDLYGHQNTLDFYLSLTKDAETTDYRLKVINSKLEDLDTLYLPDDIKGTVVYEPYETLLHSLSIYISTATLKLRHVHFTEDENSMTLSGQFKCHKQITDAPKLVFKERDGNNVIGYPINLRQDVDKCIFEVNIDQTIRDYPLSVYDLFLYATFEDGTRMVRFKTADRELRNKTLVEHQTIDDLYHSYFYKTVNNRLSFKIAEPRLLRDLKVFEFNEDSLMVQGSAFIERKSPNGIADQHLQLVLRNRETEVESQLDLEHDDFSVAIPDEVISELITDQKEIIDFYVKVTIGNFVKERKLGFESFDYVKDDYISYSSIDSGDQRIVMYVTLTPSGNVKIESFKYDEKHLELLRRYNEQDLFSSNVWMVGERPDTAQDTGYHFFRYMRENHPEKEVYYVIKEDSEDVQNVIDFGNVLFMGSDLHAQKSLEAGVFLSSHDIEYLLPFKSRDMANYQKGLKVFLQHGVLGRKPVEYHKPYYQFPFNMFCVSSTPEKYMVMDQMHYGADEVEVTGLSRFDQLHDYSEHSNRLLLIPTWREWLNTSDAFFASEYFNRYMSLLQNPKLLDLLEQHDLYIDFYPHYRMQEFVAEHDLDLHPRVNFIKLGARSVQDLIKSSKMMITDYSSVSFDFNYMSKPVVFYHFDFRRFFNKGILRPKYETFLGEIEKDENELVETIQNGINRGFTEIQEVSNKKYQAFDYIDHHNNERIYKAVVTKLNQSQVLSDYNK